MASKIDNQTIPSLIKLQGKNVGATVIGKLQGRHVVLVVISLDEIYIFEHHEDSIQVRQVNTLPQLDTEDADNPRVVRIDRDGLHE